MEKLQKVQLTKMIRELRGVATRCECSAPEALGTILKAWCELDYQELPEPNLPTSDVFASENTTQVFIEKLRSLPFLEASYWLGSFYAIAVTLKKRKNLALYFTPPSLTHGLLNDLENAGVDFCSQKFMDPASGGAAFLTPIALRIRDKLYAKNVNSKKLLKHIESHIYGADIEPALCELSKHFLRMAVYKEIVSSSYLPKFKVYNCNSLTSKFDLPFDVDVVVCNPPYRKISGEEKSNFYDNFRTIIQGQPNLYSLFFYMCVQLVKKGGLVALVTPTSFMSGQYFSKLRLYLINQTKAIHIGIVSDKSGVFINVEQETALTVLKKRKRKYSRQTSVDVSVVSSNGEYTNVGCCLLPNDEAIWPIPRSNKSKDILALANSSPFRIKDYGYVVRIGAWVWNRDTRPIYDTYDEVKRAKARTALPLLWSKDISSGGQVLFDKDFSSSDGNRFVDLGSKEHRSAVLRPSLILQRVTSNDQPKRLIPAPVPSFIYKKYGGFVGENHIVILEQTDNVTFSPDDMAKILATDAIDNYFRCISGATNVSIFELSELPLPDPVKLKTALGRCDSFDDAIRLAFAM